MSVKNKILMVLTDMNMGGVTTAAINFCNELYSRGNDVDVLVMSVNSPDRSECFTKGINVFRLKGIDGLWNLCPAMITKEKNALKKSILLLLGILKKLINRNSRWMRLLFGKKKRFIGYDVVIAYRQCAPCYYFALNCVEAEKTVAFVHGDIEYMGDISTWQTYMYSFDAVAYVSDAVKNGFVKKYPDLITNAHTIYNVFDIHGMLEKSMIPSDVEISSEVFNIVTVSRIENTMKGTDRIPYICSLLKEKHCGQFHWYVVGDGPDLEKNKKLSDELGVSDHITYLGSRNNPYNIMACADVCVLPTLTEAFPMIVGESLILGKPIITSRYPAASEIIIDGENGIIAEQNVESLCEKIVTLIENINLFLQMRDTCMAYRYDNDRSYKQFIKAITK